MGEQRLDRRAKNGKGTSRRKRQTDRRRGERTRRPTAERIGGGQIQVENLLERDGDRVGLRERERGVCRRRVYGRITSGAFRLRQKTKIILRNHQRLVENDRRRRRGRGLLVTE